MHIEFLVEESSAEACLRELLPKIISAHATWAIHSYGGKRALLDKLPSRLRAYAAWLPADWRIVILVDRDEDDCHDLKAALELMARSAGLTTRSAPGSGGRFQVLNRIAVEESEAWFFGDLQALAAAYPGVPISLGCRRGFRDPDSIRGGTWEALERVLQRAGHCRAGLPKIDCARRVAGAMDPDRNRSRSFQVFAAGLRGVLGAAG